MNGFPIVAFGILAVVFLDKAMRRGATRTWAWGRMGEAAPLSRISYAVWAMTFIAIAFTLARAPKPGLGAAIAIGVSFVAVIVMGFADTRTYRKSNREN